MAAHLPDPREEARLYLAWVRGAAGRFDWREAGTQDPKPARPPPAPSSAGPAGELSANSPRAPDDGGANGDLEGLCGAALACRRCRLAETRRSVVFGEGNPRARLLVVGEAPGADEDASGRPFVGKAGQLLTRMLAAIGLARSDVYIANVLKCRPPENWAPSPDEVAACRPFLQEQMRIISPELILVLGNHAAKAVLGTDRGITSLRGEIRTTPDGRRVLPTFHPAYLLRNPEAKREAWLDLQLVARVLGLEIPGRGGSTPSGNSDNPSNDG